MKTATPSHEYAEIFSLHEGQSQWDLDKSVEEHGLRQPIVLLDKKVLDGRRRERACIKSGIKPRYREFGSNASDGEDPLEFVMDMNLHRRHLGDGERKLAAARYAEAKAGENQKRASKSQTAQNAQSENGENNAENASSAAHTTEEAAERFNVSKADVRRAKIVEKHGTAKLKGALADGTLTVGDAAKVARESPEVQDKAVDDVRAGRFRTGMKSVRKNPKRKRRRPAPVKSTDELTDNHGNTVPRRCRDAWADPWIQETYDFLTVVSEKFRKERIADGMHKRAKHYPWFNSKDVIDGCGMIIHNLDQLVEHLKTQRPSGVCPMCSEGQGCDKCRGAGLVPREVYKKLKEKS